MPVDKQTIKELEILHEVSKNEHINQQYLSKKLGMSSGLVHLYLKRLARKGYIKVTGIKPRRLKYLLTPRGIAEKTRLTFEFALISYKYFQNATDDIRKKLRELEEAGHTNVVLYGAGELAEMCLLLIKEFDIRVVAVVDDRPEAGRFHGYPVVPLEVLPNLKFDKLVVARMDGRDDAMSPLSKVGVETESICWLLEVGVA